MPASSRPFQAGTLWSLLVERARLARRSGALQPIATEVHTIVDQGVPFQVRVVSSLARKHARGEDRPGGAAGQVNPFLPYEEDLYVSDISSTHVALLNKYNVIDHHLLIITRRFERQERALTEADFEALWRCLAEFDALGFYNSGPVAGASQPHKHLQLVPLPLGDTGPAVPIETLLVPAAPRAEPTRISRLPFRHAFTWLDKVLGADPSTNAGHTHALYTAMLSAVGFDPRLPEPPPYNLLVTRRYMLLIPRTRDAFGTVSVNALGFAGSFFVPDAERYEAIRRVGPMNLLRAVAVPEPVPDPP